MTSETRWLGYPAELQAREHEELKRRRGRPFDPQHDDRVGVALSGGGIRSATFCLGVFQALAKAGLIGRVDFLSTVSGGGYLGAFLGRMFNRPGVAGAAGVEAALRDSHSRPLNWLRESGRYLSPNGSGDTFLAAAVQFRNWTAVTVVMATTVLMFFLLACALRSCGWWACGGAPGYEEWLIGKAAASIWWSPWLLVPAVLFAWWAAPTGWAYWMTQCANRDPRRMAVLPPLTAAVVTTAACAAAALGHCRVAAGVVGLAGLLMFLVLGVAQRGGVNLETQRNRLSRQFSTALAATLGALAFALTDALGQTVYAICADEDFEFGAWKTVGSALGLSALLPAGRWLGQWLAQPGKNKRAALPTSVVATAAAVLLLVAGLVSLSWVAHGMLWNWQRPFHNPGYAMTHREPVAEVSLSPERHVTVSPATKIAMVSLNSMHYWRVWAAFAGCLALAIAFGRTIHFLNFSSQQALYAARLTRARIWARPIRSVGHPRARNSARWRLATVRRWRTTSRNPTAARCT